MRDAPKVVVDIMVAKTMEASVAILEQDRNDARNAALDEARVLIRSHVLCREVEPLIEALKR